MSDNKRSANFTSTEVNFLVTLVDKRSSTIECKRTDRVRTEEKMEAWKEIEREFNLRFSNCFRPHNVLKTKYYNLKKQAKKNVAEEKRQMYATGGGPQPKVATTSLDNTILGMCHEEQFDGTEAIYDDDIIADKYLCVEVLDEEINLSEEVKEVFEEPTPSKQNVLWEKYTPKSLKTPTNKNLKTIKPTKRETKNDLWAQVAQKKLEKVELEIEFMKEEHKLKLEKLQLEIQKLQI